MSESTKKIRCAAVITNDLGQLLVLQQGDTHRLPSREIEYTQNTNECIEAALREVQESCQIRGVQVDVATGLLELDPEKSLLLVFGWITETPELPPSSTPDSARSVSCLAGKEERAAAGSEPVERLQPPHGSGAVHSVDAAQSAGYDERTIKQNPGGAALRGFLIFSPVLPRWLLRCARSRARSRAADTGAVLSAAESLSSLHERLPACLPRLFRHPSGHFP